jgi:hypothetical protein
MSDCVPSNIEAVAAASHTRELNQLRVSNQAKLADLRSKGADLQPLIVFTQRLELLIQYLLPEGEDSRTVFEIKYETAISSILDEAASAVRKAMLTAPLQGQLNNNMVTNKIVMPPGELRG